MARRALLVLITIALATPALADPDRKALVQAVEELATSCGLQRGELVKPPVVLMAHDISLAPQACREPATGWGDFGVAAKPVTGVATDGKAAWVAADLAFTDQCFGRCPKQPISSRAHASALFEPGTPWQPIVVDFAAVGGTKPRGKPATPAAIAGKIEPGAEDVAKLFDQTLRDPAAFGETISLRKDAVMFGSERTERYVGGAAIRARLAAWKLGFRVRDGVIAGVTASKTVAWVVAHVDASKPGKPGAGSKPATPYRLFAIYEHTDAGWQVVLLSFSTPQPSS